MGETNFLASSFIVTQWPHGNGIWSFFNSIDGMTWFWDKKGN
jgi:hypothetical protein